LPRYLRAARRRLEKQLENPGRDARHAPAVQALWMRWKERMAAQRGAARDSGELADFRWDIEELRVSLFAQELKTPYPVSVKRLEKKWAELCAR
jgi:ATP-dependent helicase HrpA